jgi:hypothetical protein
MLRMMMTNSTPGAPDSGTEGEAKADNFRQHMDESGQGPRRTVAEAIAHPLEIQPSIDNTAGFSSR